MDVAYSKSIRANNESIQGKLSQVSLKLKELMEILNDDEIQALVQLINDAHLNQIKNARGLK